MSDNPHAGSSLDDLLKEDGLLKSVHAVAMKRQAEERKAAMTDKEKIEAAMTAHRETLDKLKDR